MTDTLCGRVGRDPISAIANKAASILLERRGAWAVALAPDGVVTIENPAQVIPDEWIGTWNKDLGLIGLWREIEDELKSAVNERGIRGEPRKRRVVVNKRAA